MINLLPDDNKKELRAGRANTVLRQYITIVLFALAFLAGLTGFAWVTLEQAKLNAQRRLEQSQQETNAFSETQKSAEEFRADLTTAKSILDKNIAYSHLMLRIADAFPNNIEISNLILDAETIDEPMTFDLSVGTKRDATELRKRLSQDETLFSDVHIVAIEEIEGGTRATISVTLAEGALNETED